MKKNDAVALLAAIAKANAAGNDAEVKRLSATIEQKVEPTFKAEPSGFHNQLGVWIHMVNLTGSGFRPKQISPNVAEAILDNAEAVRAAIEKVRALAEAK